MYKREREFIAWGVLCLVFTFLIGCAGTMKADNKLNQKKYSEAIPLFKEYLAKHPDSWNARGKLGFAYLKTGSMDNAIAEFKKVLKAEPGDPHSVFYLGLAYVNKDEFRKAIKVWQGYRNKKQPLVEEEIKRQLTLLQIAQSQRAAKKALAQERRLRTIKPDTNTVAVCYFQDLSPDKSLRAFQKGLTAILISDLAKIKSLKVVERVRLQALLEEMRLGQTGIVDHRTAPKVGRLLGAEKLIIGSLAVGSVRVASSMSSTSSGRIMGTTSVSVAKADFFQLPAAIITNLAKIAGITLSAAEIKAIGVPHTKNLEAFTLFGQALEAMDAGDWGKAKNLFAKVLKADPTFILAALISAGCPGAGAPTLGALKAMTAKVAAAQAEAAANDATAAQTSADSNASGEATSVGGAGGACLAYDTLVLMADNSTKRVIDMRKGDIVKAFDVETGEMVNRKVVEKYRADQNHYYLINETLKITQTHPVLRDDGEWVMVGDLKVGDRIASLNGFTEIASFKKVKYDHRVYYLGVKNTHNYFVSRYGKDFYVIHNSMGGGK